MARRHCRRDLGRLAFLCSTSDRAAETEEKETEQDCAEGECGTTRPSDGGMCLDGVWLRPHSVTMPYGASRLSSHVSKRAFRSEMSGQPVHRHRHVGVDLCRPHLVLVGCPTTLVLVLVVCCSCSAQPSFLCLWVAMRSGLRLRAHHACLQLHCISAHRPSYLGALLLRLRSCKPLGRRNPAWC